MPRLPDAQNPAKVDMPPEMLAVFAEHERRLQLLERDIAELIRQPWQADIAAVRNAIPTWSTLSGKPATFPPSSHGNEAHSSTFITSVSWAEVTSKPATFPSDTHTHDYTSGITGKPATFPPSSHGNEAHSSTFITGIAWDAVTGKPSTFTPAVHANEAHSSTFVTATNHSHAWSDITSKPSTFTPSSHGNEAHGTPGFWPYNPIPWAYLINVPSTFTPSSHGNEAHTSNYATTTHYHTHQDVEPSSGGNVTVKNTSVAI